MARRLLNILPFQLEKLPPIANTWLRFWFLRKNIWILQLATFQRFLQGGIFDNAESSSILRSAYLFESGGGVGGAGAGGGAGRGGCGAGSVGTTLH